MMGQPSSPGMCVSELRFGGVRAIGGEATLCIDMTVAPVGFNKIVHRDNIASAGAGADRHSPKTVNYLLVFALQSLPTPNGERIYLLRAPRTEVIGGGRPAFVYLLRLAASF